MQRVLRGTLATAVMALGVAAAASGVVGCKSCNDHALDTYGDGGADAAIGSLTPEQAAKVLARIDDQTITLGDFAASIEHLDQFTKVRYQSPERRKELLEDMINLRLLAREAKAKGYDQDPVAQEEERTILRNAMLGQARAQSVQPNDVPAADVHAYYDAHRADFHDPERRRASVIVLRSEAAAKQALEAAKQATTAAAFGELVKSRSTDPSIKPTTPVDLVGDVGMISPPGDPRGENPKISAPVREALFKIPGDGQIYPDVVKTGDTWTIVRLTGISVPRDRSFAEGERSIRIKLADQASKVKEDALLAELKAKFPVTIDEAALATVKVDVDGGGMPAPMANPATPHVAAADAGASK